MVLTLSDSDLPKNLWFFFLFFFPNLIAPDVRNPNQITNIHVAGTARACTHLCRRRLKRTAANLLAMTGADVYYL